MQHIWVFLLFLVGCTPELRRSSVPLKGDLSITMKGLERFERGRGVLYLQSVAQSGQRLDTAFTDSAGVARFYGLEPGEYEIDVTDDFEMYLITKRFYVSPDIVNEVEFDIGG